MYVTSILYLSGIQMQSYSTDLEINFMTVFQRKPSVHLHEESKIVKSLGNREQNGGYQGLGGVRRRRH